MNYPKGARYEGSWLDDKRHGTGSFRDVDGSLYQGEWANGHREGKGAMTYANGARYDGYWHKDKFHKSGIFTGALDDFIVLYEGEWHLNKMFGKGYMEFRNGDSFKGLFKDNKFSGAGIYTFANGASLSGKWVGGIKEGKCTFQREKEIFTGFLKTENTIYQSNVPNGFGVSVPPTFPNFEIDHGTAMNLRLYQ